MRIVIDMQGVQIELAAGINRSPLLALAAAFLRDHAEHEVILALRAGIADSVERIKGTLHPLLAPGCLRVWHASGPHDQPDALDGWFGAVSERILQAFVARLEPDLVVIPLSPQLLSNQGLIRFTGTRKDCRVAIAMAGIRPENGEALSGNGILGPGLREVLRAADLLGAVAPLTTGEIVDVFKLDLHQGFRNAERIDSETPDALATCLISNSFTAPSKSVRGNEALGKRRRLAYVSPLPPLHSGISDYSADLIPELAKYYDIEVIVDQASVSDPWIIKNHQIRNIEWFRTQKDYYDRIIYHFGNSSYHHHMFDLLTASPGVVVLHDFYLGDVANFIDAHNISRFFYSKSLYKSHGYMALLDRYSEDNLSDVINRYPCNLELLMAAQGVIVHSQYSRQLADYWYGHNFSENWTVIPLLRKQTDCTNRDQIRHSLGFKSDDFLICSFGLLGPGKLNHLLLSAWLQSELVHSNNCYLVFVGENHSGEYGVQLEKSIQNSFCAKRIRITGWADESIFHSYLVAADVAVQLRSQSRGETSAAVFDCMSQALPTVVNAHGSFVELPSEAVWMLPDEFEINELTRAMETLWHDVQLRLAIGAKARRHVLDHHNPATCARQYEQAIEQAHARSESSVSGLIRQIASLAPSSPASCDLEKLAGDIATSLPDRKIPRQVLVDVSATCRNDLKTGIQRVVRALVWELIHTPPPGYRIEPVYLTDEGGSWHYRYARTWTSRLLEIPPGWLADESVEAFADDVLLVADFTSRFAVEAEQSGLFFRMKEAGVSIHFIVYDLLPILTPEFFPPGQFGFTDWIRTVSRISDGALCISRSVAEDLRIWISNHPQGRVRTMDVDWFHLGADIDRSAPTSGLPKNARRQLSVINSSPSFLMVGTIEPRKGYLQVIEAFTKLWLDGAQINLVIVGKEGWLGLPDSQRRTIPAIIERLKSHPESGRRLLWMDGASDEFLLSLYDSCTCLIAASEGEGFGLPLIEAAQHKIPIIARNISVFKEVAGEHAFYFEGLAPENLSDAIRKWLELNSRGAAPSSRDMPWLSWKQSAHQVQMKLGLVHA
jgi:glycosyltransferase involved in cell wall biosynthesis